MSTLDWITVKGFKSIKSIEELELRPINVLIGSNGAGKSNFMEVFSLLNTMRLGGLRDYVMRSGGADRILHFGSKTTQQLSIEIGFENGKRKYNIDLAPNDADGMFPSNENVYTSVKQETIPDDAVSTLYALLGRDSEAGISNTKQKSRAISYVREHLFHWRLYQFHDTSSSSPIKKTVPLNDNRYLRHDGSNLAAFLYYLREKHGRSYDMIRRTVRLVAPFFDDFFLEPLALNEDTIRLEWRHQGSDDYFDVSSLSDGTLRFIALATLLLQPTELRPSVILLDEPELGLHPAAIAILSFLIKQASVETQIVVATQSSLLLDNFNPEDVLVAERVEGATQFTRLEGEKLKIWLEDYSLGQLWEKNELGGRPAPEFTDREST
ncbi:MAG: AAA family ATPase [Candidatus Poribacteria bacterium]|nr:AAA family ATPase [Candidatus Poribacteria bacterium]MDE0504226.1 AAA family ATPase [Candidatus Poribacteria bacterium]